MMIRSINLDPMFVPVPYPEIKFEAFKFSGGEQHIRLNNLIDYSKIDGVIMSQRIHDGDDIMKILVAKDALMLKGIKKFDLVIPYVPYARQDRQCADGESFSLKVFTSLINAQNFDHIYVMDAHSNVAPGLLNNCINIDNSQYVSMALDDMEILGPVYSVSPDSGSNSKNHSLIRKIGRFEKIIACDKIRDPKTGKLSGFQVFAEDLNKVDCMIVDDLCDAGGTFIGIAKELKEKNAGDIYLFVTHGIFSKGFKELSEHFKKIYCTNSFSDIQDNWLDKKELYIRDLVKQFKIQI